MFGGGGGGVATSVWQSYHISNEEQATARLPQQGIRGVAARLPQQGIRSVAARLPQQGSWELLLGSHNRGSGELLDSRNRGSGELLDFHNRGSGELLLDSRNGIRGAVTRLPHQAIRGGFEDCEGWLGNIFRTLYVRLQK